MPVIELPAALRSSCQGRARVTVEGASVGAALEALCREAPALRAQLFAANGQLKRTIGVFLGDEDVREQGGLDAPVGPAQAVVVIAAVAGG